MQFIVLSAIKGTGRDWDLKVLPIVFGIHRLKVLPIFLSLSDSNATNGMISALHLPKGELQLIFNPAQNNFTAGVVVYANEQYLPSLHVCLLPHLPGLGLGFCICAPRERHRERRQQTAGVFHTQSPPECGQIELRLEIGEGDPLATLPPDKH